MRGPRRPKWWLLCLAGALALVVSEADAAARSSFETWLRALAIEAQDKGIRHATVERALRDIEPLPRVIALDRKQPELRLSFVGYLDLVVPPARIDEARRRLAEHRSLLERLGRKYGVPPAVIVALWGIESDFGRQAGGYPVIAALATLAYDGRRSAFFRSELLAALHILDGGHITLEEMLGSWAGAMGQSQFMPSSFLKFAVDEDGDGRRDIWFTAADIFGSTANYLAGAGWTRGAGWAQAVRLPASLVARAPRGRLPLSEWQALGVRTVDGGALPDSREPAALERPDGQRGAAFLVQHNFDVFLAWNRSRYFALAVGHLADRLNHR